MIRQVAAIVLSLCLNTTSLSAQSGGSQGMKLTVKSAADVHKFASIGSPVIGRAPRGTVLEITRNLGSWVEVPWADGEGGVAFLHVNAGTISGQLPVDSNRVVAPPVRPMTTPAPSVASAGAGAEQITAAPQAPSRQVYISLPNHNVGLGGRISPSAESFGATSRAWWGNRVGLQFEVSRYRLDSIEAPGRLTSIQFAPSALYALPNAVTDSLWLRPYIGGGVSFHRATLRGGPSGLMSSPVDSGMGLQTFGGAEVTLAGIPQFSLSADLGYRRSRTTFTGFDEGKIGFSMSGHWYIK